MNKFDKAEIDRRVRQAAEMLHIETMLDRYPFNPCQRMTGERSYQERGGAPASS
jgi:ABC-type Fe3+/spermidine/putrescine transport system ATPase subunit